MASIVLKNMRRGIQDYELFWLADSLGVPEATLQTIIKMAAPYAFLDSGALDGPPKFAGTKYWYDTTGLAANGRDGMAGWSHSPWPLRGYYYEQMRRVLIDTINGRLGSPITPPPSGTFTASASTVTAPGDSVGFNWTASNGDSIIISHGKDGASGWRALTYATSGVDSIWIGENTTVYLRIFNSELDSVERQVEVTYDDGGVTAGELISDGGFESYAIGTYWDDSPNAILTRSASDPKIGSYKGSWAVTNPTGSWEQIFTKEDSAFAITGGQQYRVRLNIYSTDTASVHFSILTAGTYQSVGFSNKLVAYGESAWTRFDSTFTATASGNCYIRIAAKGTSTQYAVAGSTVYIDSVSIVPVVSLGAPSITAPVNEATGVDTSVWITWTSVDNALGYKLDIDTNSNFSEVVTWNLGNQTTIYFSDLVSSTTYYTRAFAYNGYGNGDTSSTVSFTTIASGIAPTDTPSVKSTVFSTGRTGLGVETATFGWNGIDGVTSYQVQMLIDTAGATDSTAWPVSDTSFVLGRDGPNPPLPYRQWHYWRVRAINSAGQGPWSDWVQFKTAAEEALRSNRGL